MNTSEVSYSKSRRLKNQILNVVTNPYNVIVLITIILLLYLIVFLLTAFSGFLPLAVPAAVLVILSGITGVILYNRKGGKKA